MKVTLNNREVDFDACAERMDDDLREKIHEEVNSEDPQEFLDVYCAMHQVKFNEKFDI